jgi:transposase InsO family protein
LFKTEALGPGNPFRSGPLKTLADVEYPTMESVDWYNNQRLHGVMDYVPPEEYKSTYYAQLRGSQPAMSQT